MSDRTLQLIRTLRPDLRPAAVWLINQLRADGLPAIVVSARRTADRQRALIRAGRTTALRSLHLSGLAMDIGFANVRTADAEAAGWFQWAGSKWQSIGGRWGGNFHDRPDVVHFDSGLT